MEKVYEPQLIERDWYNKWESLGYFAPQSGEDSYCIMLPPPNVTGSLHMGHAFQQTLMDILTRYKRMQGISTLWQCGTDHAGIATQMVVERQLEAKGTNRLELGREAFTSAVWDWKENSGNTITGQSRRLGTSMNWSRERFTMDEGLSASVMEVFIQLYDEGLIYRGKRLVNWDPVLHTAISDLEVISEEENGHMWHMRYPIVIEGDSAQEYLTVATTRPETMLGDAAVAVHPEDERYQHLIGKQVALPLTDRLIPVIADDYVDPAFGTGCVKITPAHDFNDYAVGKRHDLPLINIFTIDAAVNENAPDKYRDMDRYVARKQIVKDLDELGLLEKIDDHKLMVPRGDRSNAVVEPYLTDQWYVKIQPLADPAIKAVEDGEIRFVPENWSKTYFEWMNNIEDWCISRQLWWGHRIPAWYDDKGNIYVAKDEASVREKYKLDDDVSIRQDEDVLDTWFSSALWPFSTLGWPEKTPELQKYYPTSVLVTGFDIIFFWVARMIMMGIKFMGDVPFKEVYIHGLVRNSEGQKMSKSKGNILDPIDLIDGIELEQLVEKRTGGLMQPKLAPKIEKSTRKHFPDGIESYGTDALRFTFAALATQGRGINFDVGRIGGYRNFCNKIWNATRYIMMTVEQHDLSLSSGDKQLGVAERWINTQLAITVDKVKEGMRTYRFDLAAQAIYEYTWDQYCDWYLELSKTNLNREDISDAEKRGTLYTLIANLETLLRLMHPFMPFITEELWHKVAPLIEIKGDTIMLQTYPESSDFSHDKEAHTEIEWLKLFILGIRRIRSERDIAPGKALAVQVIAGSSVENEWLDRNTDYLASLAKIDNIARVESEPTDAIIALAGDMTIAVPLADLIDPVKELEKLEKDINKLENAITGLKSKLANGNFVDKAPAEVVAKERERLVESEGTLEKLSAQYERIKDMIV